MRSAGALLAIISFLLPVTTCAQFSLEPTADTLSLTTAPQYPRPGAIIVVTPKSASLDLGRSTMTLSIGGKNIYSGGVKGVPVTLKSNGLTTTISVTVTTDGTRHTKSITIRPADVSLIAEPISSSPALYPGKALIPQGGSVRYAAIADFRTSPTVRLDPDTLSYSWNVNGTTILSASGIGKDSIILPAPLTYRSEKISVDVQSRNGGLIGSDTMTVTPQNSTVRFYVNDPLQGILFDHALSGSHAITGSEATMAAVPFSLSLASGAPIIRWFLNGSPVETGSNITLRPEGAGQGSASLSATASAGTETSTAALSIIFGSSSTNIFGL